MLSAAQYCCIGIYGIYGCSWDPPLKLKKMSGVSVSGHFYVEGVETALGPASFGIATFEDPFQKRLLNCTCVQNFYRALTTHFIVTCELLTLNCWLVFWIELCILHNSPRMFKVSGWRTFFFSLELETEPMAYAEELDYICTGVFIFYVTYLKLELSCINWN